MTLYRLTGCSVVSEEAKDYVFSWLYALSLVWGVDIPQLTLPPHVAQASFALCELISHRDQDEIDDADVDAEETAKGGASPVVSLEWETAPLPLPADLKYLWEKSREGQRLPLREVLEGVPNFSDLPAKAPENNHRQDGKAAADRVLKSVQQGILQSLRLLVTSYGHLVQGEPEQGQQRFQQSFCSPRRLLPQD